MSSQDDNKTEISIPFRECTKVCFANTSVCSQDELSNDIESLLEEIKDVQTRLSDLPDESLEAMEEGLTVSSHCIYIIN